MELINLIYLLWLVGTQRHCEDSANQINPMYVCKQLTPDKIMSVMFFHYRVMGEMFEFCPFKLLNLFI